MHICIQEASQEAEKERNLYFMSMLSAIEQKALSAKAKGRVGMSGVVSSQLGMTPQT